MDNNSKKPIIFCFVGESASGKSRASNYVEKAFGVEIIKSYTTRHKRMQEIINESNGLKLDHKFITDEQFDAIPDDVKIAFTQFGAYRYCCTTYDVAPINMYLIDETGLDYLKDHYSTVYDIITFRFTCPYKLRLERSGGDKERCNRDSHKFKKPLKSFDYVINTGISDTHVIGCTLFNNINDELRKRLIYLEADWNVEF